MSEYTPEQRRVYADAICQLIREFVVERESDFELELQRGVEWRPEIGTEDRHPRPNSSITLSLKINGGAQETEGAPILSTPPIFRPPPD